MVSVRRERKCQLRYAAIEKNKRDFIAALKKQHYDSVDSINNIPQIIDWMLKLTEEIWLFTNLKELMRQEDWLPVYRRVRLLHNIKKGLFRWE